MRILILGGTHFLGRHLVEAALARGHDVTLLNKGKTNPDLYPDVEQLRGDRDGQLEVLQGRQWEAVIDTSGYVPRIVRQSVEMLSDKTELYTFISSISVYADFSRKGMDEQAPLGRLEDETSEDVQQHYGPLKARCEKEVSECFDQRALIIRPGLIVGPYDPTDRFTYWVRRFAQGGDVLVPDKTDFQLQFIDARDLAEWTIRMVERKANGIYNATGPKEKLVMHDFVREVQRTVPDAGRAVWVSDAFLASREVGEFVELPLWVSEQRNWSGFLAVNTDRALQQGLTFRPLSDTIRDTLHWDQARAKDVVLKAGLTPRREADLLREWRTWQAEQADSSETQAEE